MKWWFIDIFLLFLLTLLLHGCSGGSDSSPLSSAQNASASFSVLWPSRDHRLIPDLAETITVTITSASGFHTEQTTTRPAEGETSTTLLFDRLPLDLLTIDVQAYPDPVSSSVPVAGNSQTHDTRVEPHFSIDITMNSAIDRIEVTPGVSVFDLGAEGVTLSAIAYDTQDRQVLVNPTRLRWSSSDPDAVAVTGNGDGSAQLMLHQSTSQPVTVTVLEEESQQTGTAMITVNTVQVSVDPATATVNPTESIDFHDWVTVIGALDTNVTWTVPEGAGTVTEAGVYTAPNQHGSYTVTATSVADPTKSAAIIVDVPLVLSLSPAMTTVLAGPYKSVTIAAKLKGSGNGVNWSYEPVVNGSNIMTTLVSFTYFTPSTVPVGYQVTVTATSRDKHNGSPVQATATITVLPSVP